MAVQEKVKGDINVGSDSGPGDIQEIGEENRKVTLKVVVKKVVVAD